MFTWQTSLWVLQKNAGEGIAHTYTSMCTYLNYCFTIEHCFCTLRNTKYFKFVESISHVLKLCFLCCVIVQSVAIKEWIPDIELIVTGMTCKSCEAAVLQSLLTYDDVLAAAVALEPVGIVFVQTIRSSLMKKVSSLDVESIIEGLGYVIERERHGSTEKIKKSCSSSFSVEVKIADHHLIAI